MAKIIVLIAAFCAILGANSFTEAITSGKKEGDIYLLVDYAKFSRQETRTKYQDNAYLAASLGLYYASSFYGNFRAHLGFRGAIPLIQAHKSSVYEGGRRDAARDFWSGNRVAFARSYLEYFDGDTSVRLGRLEIESDLIDKQFDGIWVANKSLGYLLIDLVWINQYGRVLPREITDFRHFDTKYGGAYHLGITMDMLEWLKFKLYALSSPRFYEWLGANLKIKTDYVSANLGAVIGSERKRSTLRDNNTSLIHANLSVHINIFAAQIGYLKSGKTAGIGNMNTLGNNFSPFFYFSGDAFNLTRNAQLFYGKLGIEASMLSAFVLYGYNTFQRHANTADSTRYKQGEVNVKVDWKMSEAVNLTLYYINTHGGGAAIPLNNQFGVAVGVGF